MGLIGDNKSREKLYAKMNKVNSTLSAAAVVATASMPNTTLSVEVFDDTGASLGFMALYANATLT